MASNAVAVRSSALAMMPTNLDEAIRLASLMAQNGTLPEVLRGNSGNCLMIVEQAIRWGMSVYAVAQCTFECRGKIGYEGKLVHAAVENSGVITDDGFDDIYEGDYPSPGSNWLKEQPTRKITLTATRVGQKKPRSIELSWADAFTTNKDGTTINAQWAKPARADQMLYYLATRMWTRRYAPAVLLGVYTRDEIENPDKYDTSDAQTIDGFIVPDEQGTARDRVDAAVDRMAAETAGRQQAEAKPDSQPAERIYPFNTMRFAREHRNADHWIMDWEKFAKGCVAADAPDRLQNTYEMNGGSLDQIATFDFEARNKVFEIIQAGLSAIKAKREGQATGSTKEGPGKAQERQQDANPPDDGAPPNMGEQNQAIDQQAGRPNAENQPTLTSQEKDASGHPDKPSQAETEKAQQREEWLIKARSWLGKFAAKVESLKALPDRHMGVSRISNMLVNQENMSMLQSIRGEDSKAYFGLVVECCDSNCAEAVIANIQDKNDVFYHDMLTHMESQSLSA